MKLFTTVAAIAAFTLSSVAMANPNPKPAPVAAPAPVPVAQEVAPIDPVAGIQGFGALGTTTTLSIIAGVVTVGVLVASNDETNTLITSTN